MGILCEGGAAGQGDFLEGGIVDVFESEEVEVGKGAVDADIEAEVGRLGVDIYRVGIRTIGRVLEDVRVTEMEVGGEIDLIHNHNFFDMYNIWWAISLSADLSVWRSISL